MFDRPTYDLLERQAGNLGVGRIGRNVTEIPTAPRQSGRWKERVDYPTHDRGETLGGKPAYPLTLRNRPCVKSQD